MHTLSRTLGVTPGEKMATSTFVVVRTNVALVATSLGLRAAPLKHKEVTIRVPFATRNFFNIKTFRVPFVARDINNHIL